MSIRDPKDLPRPAEPPRASAGPKAASKPRPAKPGQGVGRATTDDDVVMDKEAEARNTRRLQPDVALKQAQAPENAKPSRDRPDARDEKGQRGQGQGQGGGEAAPRFVPPTIQVGGSFSTSRGKGMGIEQALSPADFIKAQDSPRSGRSFAEVMPGARMWRDDLPEPERRPPSFLSTFEGMKDVYMQVKGRMSPRTKELLEGTDLEDLVKGLTALHEDEAKVRAPEARVSGPIYAKLKGEPGPLLLGLQDPRLREPWRLFLEGWEIWVPDKKDVAGVELFWEGEAEDDAGDPMEIVQTLRRASGEISLETKLGALHDVLSFDGKDFFRLKSDRS